MDIWNNARMDIAFYDDSPALARRRCDVRLNRGVITVSGLFDGVEVTLQGMRRGQGHYHLSAPGSAMQATLHRFNESEILEGFWTKGGRRGFWRITLGEQLVGLAVVPSEIVLKTAQRSKQQRRPRARARAA